MPRKSKVQILEQRIESLTYEYEKKIYDLTQLIELSKSLNSSLEFNTLIQSVLYICMGQLRVLKAGIFVRKDISRHHLVLHRNQVGFDIDHSVSYMIPEDHRLLPYLQDHFECHTMEELRLHVPEVQSLSAITTLDPCLVIPLRSKNVINGIILLGEPIDEKPFSPDDRQYAMTIATLCGVAVYNAWLYEVTTTDMMTHLKMRHFFMDNLGTTMSDARRGKKNLFLIMLDIDNFKKLNDTHGHVAGDQVIKNVALIMLNNIRGTDLAARYGGEEFVLLIKDCEQETAIAIAERIRISIQDSRLDYQGTSLSVTISLGIALYDPSRDLSPTNLIERADKALYSAKTGGKNTVCLADHTNCPIPKV